ncbi:succinylglutamate-semialdehyde dehydrogenase [Vibrio viridaestus]|uniref:N-succinylglutamate 5-semialdehyde dehydrogenase n=1 Tax=Vibrio viridaestus TaxID=2487322 RepID=A0A3N9TC43_9VIBR|nr:succinylglutamate-semialdehyde dehydrogenase [Vibrio viridaestus]RQW61639.1 succinylglutamate-semialdehyde dehydrogenase [Vibrio viridaestus]
MSLYIAGHWQQGLGDSFHSYEPYSSVSVWDGNGASQEQVEEAIASARNALSTWKKRPFQDREKIVLRFAEEVKNHADELAQIISRETGKPFWETKTEVAAVSGKIGLSIDAYHQRTGHSTQSNNDVEITVTHRPIGVLAVFGAYNFPCHLPNGHIVPALLAGNTVVFKPSELTPLSGEKMVRLWESVGLPKGVLNLVQGAKNTGIALANAKNIDGLLFTGSADTGQIIHRAFGGYPEKMLALEMGGNNPLVVTEKGGDFSSVVYQIIQSAYLSSGQRCTCARRLLIPDSEYGDQLIEHLCLAIQSIRMDQPFAQPQPFMGPLISAEAAKALERAQKHLLSIGGKALVLGKLGPYGFFSPALIDVTDINQLPDEEYFGPLLQVIRYDQFPHAVSIANDTRFGLSAGLISLCDQEWNDFQETIRAGIVNRNRPLTGASGSAPFGGPGASGNYRPGAYYAADYCAYPMASMASKTPQLPDVMTPGLDHFAK